jgi:energy-coupling factor transporter transmembrane protein EcfT
VNGQRLTPLLSAAAVALAAGLTRHPLPLVLLVAAMLVVAPRPRWPVLAFAVVGFVMNGLFSWHGATSLWVADFTVPLLGRPRLTAEALTLGLATAMQVAVVSLAFLVAFSRTSPQAVARLVPGTGPRLAVRIGLRALPDLAEDARAMRAGLAVRGVETHGVRGAGNLLVPLVSRSLDRAMQTVEVLYARGAGARPRASMPLAWGTRDVVAVALLAALAACWLTGLWPQADYFPHLSFEPVASIRTWVPAAAVLAVPGVARRA